MTTATRPAITIALAALLPLLCSCSRPGQEVLGHWKTAQGMILDVERNGDNFLVTFSGGNRTTMVYREGVLTPAGGGESITYLPGKDALLRPGLPGLVPEAQYQRVR